MDVKFENGEVPIWKIRQGTLVRFNHDYYFVKYFDLAPDGRFVLTLDNSYEKNVEVNPKFVEWLEPM